MCVFFVFVFLTGVGGEDFWGVFFSGSLIESRVFESLECFGSF